MKIQIYDVIVAVLNEIFFSFLLSSWLFSAGLLRLQQIYQGLRPGNETFQVETVKRIANATNAIDFLRTLEELNRWSKKFIVLDCPTDMAKDIVVYHVRDLSLGRRTYHYLLSGLVSSSHSQLCVRVCGRARARARAPAQTFHIYI